MKKYHNWLRLDDLGILRLKKLPFGSRCQNDAAPVLPFDALDHSTTTCHHGNTQICAWTKSSVAEVQVETFVSTRGLSRAPNHATQQQALERIITFSVMGFSALMALTTWSGNGGFHQCGYPKKDGL